MREIKFRVWDIKNQEFFYPNELRIRYNQIGWTADHYLDIDSWGSEGYILQQFTGITDKNGIDIYEGDIVKYKTQYHFEVEYEVKAEVEFENGEFFPLPKDDIVEGDDFYSVYRKDYEVIGNIFENKDLLN